MDKSPGRTVEVSWRKGKCDPSVLAHKKQIWHLCTCPALPRAQQPQFTNVQCRGLTVIYCSNGCAMESWRLSSPQAWKCLGPGGFVQAVIEIGARLGSASDPLPPLDPRVKCPTASLWRERRWERDPGNGLGESSGTIGNVHMGGGYYVS